MRDETSEYGLFHQTSVTAGTILHASKLPLTVWFWAAYLMATHSNDISCSRWITLVSQRGSFRTTERPGSAPRRETAVRLVPLPTPSRRSGYAAVPADRHNVHVVGKTAAWIHQVFSNLKGWARGVYHGLRRMHLRRTFGILQLSIPC